MGPPLCVKKGKESKCFRRKEWYSFRADKSFSLIHERWDRTLEGKTVFCRKGKLAGST